MLCLDVTKGSLDHSSSLFESNMTKFEIASMWEVLQGTKTLDPMLDCFGIDHHGETEGHCAQSTTKNNCDFNILM